MANNPYVNKVELANGTTLIDLSTDTAVASDVAQGKYFHLATGERVEGTASGGGAGAISIVDTADSAGGTVRTITAVDISNDTVTAGSILSGVTAHSADGTAITGNIATKTGSDLSASGDTVTVPAGYYASQSTKSVASGTAGTPTATKGTVSNHSVSVAPSVTNTAGYISGGTINGTAVTVSASELVSGSETKTANGTYDVTNLAQLIVNVSGGSGLTYETGTYKPSSNTAQPTISFQNTHSKPPAFVAISDVSDVSTISQNSNTSWMIVDYYRITGYGFPYSTTGSRYGLVTYSYRGSNSTTVSTVQIQYNSDDTGTGSNSYYRYWATASSFKPSSTSTTRYWRSGRSYKWIAVWV